jgi:DNA-binding Lrp family transcriptional regulator
MNLRIINALLNNPNTKSKELSRSQSIPLSTIQRRRTILEHTILTKQYTVNVREFGWRTGDLFVSVEKAKSDEIAQALLSDANVISASTRVGDLEVNVSARVYYKSTEELHRLIEKTKGMPNVKDVEWSEEVRMYHKEQDVMLGTVFHPIPREGKKNLE